MYALYVESLPVTQTHTDSYRLAHLILRQFSLGFSVNGARVEVIKINNPFPSSVLTRNRCEIYRLVRQRSYSPDICLH